MLKILAYIMIAYVKAQKIKAAIWDALSRYHHWKESNSSLLARTKTQGDR
jgi:hypothetical protein